MMGFCLSTNFGSVPDPGYPYPVRDGGSVYVLVLVQCLIQDTLILYVMGVVFMY